MNSSELSYLKKPDQPRWTIPVLVPALLIVWVAAASVFVLLDLQSVYRPLVTLSFLLLAPGLAVVRLLRLPDHLLEWSLAIALSLAIGAIVATLFIYVHAWSLQLILLVLACLTFFCAVIDLIQSSSAPSSLTGTTEPPTTAMNASSPTTDPLSVTSLLPSLSNESPVSSPVPETDTPPSATETPEQAETSEYKIGTE
jgi:hypothetical protein